jgi:hypothetical protein
MTRLFAIFCLSLSALPAFAATAYFTGRMQQVHLPNNAVGWTCQYSNGGKTFWRTFQGNCPAQVRV